MGKSHGAHPNLPQYKQACEETKEARDLIMKLWGGTARNGGKAMETPEAVVIKE
ncbi:MAG: hypothetical protein OEZ48_04420 [Candidatus Bathyarchaeota archaeon]|nr:hypothetical protein [Candidatus Bathyarchaeota archaeon]MDH5687088.1 hypothetical protein [Candidatus Bathyarchaeota archaeon]